MEGISNLDKYHFASYNAMLKQYHGGEEVTAFETAKTLLLDDELPILMKARCHMILSTDDENPFFLEHAKEAVRVINEDFREESNNDESKFPHEQYKEAQRLLKEAQDEVVTLEKTAAEEPELVEEEEEEEEAEPVEDDVGGGSEEDEEMSENVDTVPELPPGLSKADALLVKEALSFGANKKTGLFTPATSKAASRTTSGISQSRVSRQSSNRSAQGAPPTPKKDITASKAEAEEASEPKDPEGEQKVLC